MKGLFVPFPVSAVLVTACNGGEASHQVLSEGELESRRNYKDGCGSSVSTQEENRVKQNWMRSRARAVAVIVVAAALVASACGSSSKSTTATTAAAVGGTATTVQGATSAPSTTAAAVGGTATTVQGATSASCATEKTPIPVAAVGNWSGVLAALLANSVKTVQAWVAYKNAQGGVNGHCIKLYVLDDGDDPAKNQALTQQAVEQDHVIAFLENGGALTQPASLAYITQHKIPIIGTAEMYSYDSPYYFPTGPNGNNAFTHPGYADAAFAGRAKNLKNVGVLTCSEIAQCGDINTAGTADGQKYGFNLVYSGRASLTAPDYTAQCQAAKAAGVEVFFPVLDAAGLQRLAHSCGSVNFHPQYVFDYSDVDYSFLTTPDFNGAYVNLPVLPWTNTGNSSIALSQKVLSQYAPDLKPDAASTIGWVATQLFDLAAQKLPDPATPEALATALWSIKNNDVGGLTVPLTFTQGQPAPNTDCLWLVQIKDGKFNTANNGQKICD